MKSFGSLLCAVMLLLVGASPLWAQTETPDESRQVRPPTERSRSMLDIQREWLAKNKDRKNRSETLKPDITREKVETRACTNDDILGGMWKMVYYREEPPREADRFNRKIQHQYLSFPTPGYFTRFKSARSIDDEQQARRLMKPNPNPDYAQKFTLTENEGKGEIIFMSGKKAVARQSCSIVLKPLNTFKPGDMILTGYTLGGKSLLYELYRRWF